MWILADLPFELIPPNNFWWLSRSPPPTPTCLLFKEVRVVPPLNPSKVFSDPPFWVLSYDWSPPPQGINNDRSLMHFAIIMQHANMAYHVQRTYKGPTIWLLRGGGWWYGWFQKKTSWSLILSTRKILQGNTCHTIALYVREKYSITRGSGEKNSYANLLNHPYPAQSQMAGP